jgi:translocation and assembly module TamB
MKRFVLYGLILFSGLSVLALGFVLFSGQGLRVIIQAADRAIPGRLSAGAVRGSLAGGFTLENIQYIDESTAVAVDTLSLAWNLAGLLDRSIIIRSLDVGNVDLALAEGETAGADSAEEDIFSPLFSLPLSLRVHNAAVQSVSLSLPGEDRSVQIAASSLKNASIEAGRIDFERLSMAGPSWQFSAGGLIENGREVSIRLTAAYVVHPEGYQPIEGTGEITGSFATLHFSMQLRRPFAGVLRGTVHDLQAEAGWEAELRTDYAELSAISREWPDFIFSDFQAHGSGTLAAYSLLVQADAAHADIGVVHVKTAVNGDTDGLRLSDTVFSRGGGYLAGGGMLDWQRDFSWQAELTGTEVNPAEINQDWPDITLSDVAFSGNGILDAYRLQIEADAAYGEMRDLHLTAAMEGDADGLRFTEAAVRRMDGVVTGQGSLSWKEDFSWQAALTGREVDPAVILPQWPGRLDFEGRSSGMLFDERVRMEIHLDSLAGELRSYPLQANGTISLDGDNYTVDRFFLETGGSTLEATGRIGDTIDLRLTLHSSDLTALWPDVSGSMRAAAAVQGNRRQPVFRLDLAGERLSLNDVFIGGLIVDAGGHLSPKGEIRASIRADELRMPGGQLAFLHLDMQGVTENHRLRMEAAGKETGALLEFAGGLRDKTWEGRIDRADIVAGRFGNWQLSEPGALRLAGREILLERTCLRGVESAMVCLAGEHDPDGPWQAEGEISSLPLSLLPIEHNRFQDIRGRLAGTVIVEGDGAAILGGRLDLATTGASLLLALPEGNSLHRLTWRDNSLHAVYEGGLLTATVKSILQDGSFMHLSAAITDVHPVPFSLEGAHVDGFLEVSVQDLEPLAALTYPNFEPSGSLRGNLVFIGPVSGPEVRGAAELVQGKVSVLPLGITVEGLKMSMEAMDGALGFHLSALSGDGELLVDTKFSWPRKPDEPITAAITGDRFELINVPEIRLWVSPDLRVTVRPGQAELKGTIKVPEALIAPRNLTGTVSPSRDVVIIGDGADQEQQGWSLYADVMVVAGENVRIDSFGLRGKVDGQLRVVDLPSKPVIGEGSLHVKEGIFVFYGRGVRIETGRLLFSGGPIDNPGIEVRAENTSSGATTGIQVSGFLQEPEISFYSSPPMTEDQIITRLLMNTSLIGASGEDGGFLGGITEDTGLDKLSATVQEIRESLHVDDIRIERGQASEDLSLVIGTWLTPSLYISYGKNLLKESGSFNTRYRLGRGFFLETETGSTQSGADLKYELDR